MEKILQKVYDFADRAHAGQRRKYTPEPYIIHPKRVMEICRQFNPRLPVLAAALLHDVLEDTDVDVVQMSSFLKSVMPHAEAVETLSLVVDLTDVYVKPAYPQWNRRVRKSKELERLVAISPEAQTVKYADILDNCREITVHDTGFAPRFLRECHAILKKADRGNPELRAEALEIVEAGLRKLGLRP